MLESPEKQSELKQIAENAGYMTESFFEEINKISNVCIHDSVIEDGEIIDEYHSDLRTLFQ